MPPESTTPPRKLLVLLAAYQGENWLQEQVDSILTQKQVECHLLISVDTPSADGTEALVDKLCQQHANIHQLPSKHHGIACKNFYYLLSQAPDGYDFYAFADQDDIWLPDKCATAIQALNDHSADGYSSNVLAFWPDGSERLLTKSHPQASSDYLMEAPGPGCTFVFTTTLLRHLQHYLTHHHNALERIEYHDWLVYAIARGHKLNWCIDEFAGVRYRQHESNQQGANIGAMAAFKRWKQLLGGHWFDQASEIAGLLAPVDKNSQVLCSRLKTPPWGLLQMAAYSYQYRRKNKDRAILSLASLALIFMPHRWRR